MKQFARIAVMFLVGHVLLLPTSALAGIADSPLPVLVAGKTTYHVYSVSGVIDNIYNFGTYFSCTSTDAATIQVGVELFDSDNQSSNDAVATSVSLGPYHSVMFETHQTAGALWGSNLSLTGPIYAYPGSARILATSKKLICTAFLADSSNEPPTSMVHLTIIKKKTQICRRD
jgi:hypothetical protein